MIMIGRLFGAFGFGIVFLYTAELFPTKIRNTAIGTCSTIGTVIYPKYSNSEVTPIDFEKSIGRKNEFRSKLNLVLINFLVQKL